jgi:uncharacterized protein
METYHIRRTDREIKDKEEINEILRTGKYATLSLSKENIPYVVTLTYGYDDKSNTMFFHCAKDGKKIEFIKSNPVVCGTIIRDHGYIKGQCKHQYASIVFYGKIRILDSEEMKLNAFEVMLNQLEDKPELMMPEIRNNPSKLSHIHVLSVAIESIRGKRGT